MSILFTCNVFNLSCVILSLLSLIVFNEVCKLATFSVNCFFSDSRKNTRFFISRFCLLNKFPASTEADPVCIRSYRKYSTIVYCGTLHYGKVHTKYMYQCVHYIKYTSIYKVHVPMCPLYKVHLYIQSTRTNVSII